MLAPKKHESRSASEAVRAALAASLRTLEREQPDARGRPLVVACSGGGDSLALLLGLYALLGPESAARRLVVCHVQHGLRGDAAERDAHAVERLAQQLGLHCDLVPVEIRRKTGSRTLSLEEAARVARYQALAAVARRHQAAAVLTAHHRDDQIETLLLRLLAGTGLDGLAAMSPCRPLEERHPTPLLLRPFLGLPRKTLRAFVADTGLRPRLDRTNLDPAAARRNRVRLLLRPWLEQRCPELGARLIRLASQAQRLQAPMRAAASARLHHVRTLAELRHREPVFPLAPKPDSAPIALDRLALEPLRQTAPWLLPDLVRAWLRERAGYTPLRRHTQAILRLITRAHGGGRIALPERIQVRRERKLLLLERTIARDHADTKGLAVQQPRFAIAACGETSVRALALRVICRQLNGFEPVRPPTQPCCAQFDLDAIGDKPLWLRTRLPGDRFQPLGMCGSKKVQDLLTDTHLPRPLRDRVLVLQIGNEIGWVIGLRLDRRFAATERSHRVLEIEVTPNARGSSNAERP